MIGLAKFFRYCNGGLTIYQVKTRCPMCQETEAGLLEETNPRKYVIEYSVCNSCLKKERNKNGNILQRTKAKTKS